MQYGARIKDRVNAGLASCVAEWFPELPPPAQDALRAIPARGKRLRACLVAEAFGARMEAAMPAALAIEMIHAASLAPFPDNESTRLLAEAPAEFVRRALTMAEPYAVR